VKVIMNTNPRKTEPPRFLSGWKEIASYLSKGVRTVQRYERYLGLPVRRPAGKSRGSVVATRAELDAWVSASPIREAFHLAKPLEQTRYRDSAAALTKGLAEMQRLREQMISLRSEITTTVYLLKATVEGLQSEMSGPMERGTPPLAILDIESQVEGTFGLAGAHARKQRAS
jgi:hypothetical protein